MASQANSTGGIARNSMGSGGKSAGQNNYVISHPSRQAPQSVKWVDGKAVFQYADGSTLRYWLAAQIEYLIVSIPGDQAAVEKFYLDEGWIENEPGVFSRPVKRTPKPAPTPHMEVRVCDVCRLVDGDVREKSCTWCGFCKAWICSADWSNVVRRAKAAALALLKK
jgi:hypothetical protein